MNPPNDNPKPLEKTYDPHALEEGIYQTWEQGGEHPPNEKAGYFAPRGTGPAYCIMIPPPNVTGSLHMGHAFQDTIMDALIRYHRMRGYNTLWQAGTDHAGIATQMVVERQLELEGKKRHDLGLTPDEARKAFLQRVWKWKEESGGMITRQLRRMGASLDWSRERFTMDEGLSHAVTEVFVRLYEEGLIYRGKRLVNWDPVLQTAVSDLEVISEEEAGHLWHIRYPIVGSKDSLVVATTRPETMLGDAAVAVHPDDKRYGKLIGKKIKLPLTGREIPIIADEYVDPEFGSGCVKITPAHDFNDYQVAIRHKLPFFVIFTPDARIISDKDWPAYHKLYRRHDMSGITNVIDMAVDIGIPEHYRGLDRFEARKQIVADLKEQGLLEKVQDHKLMVPRGDRTGAVIEPYFTDQWYVKVAPLAAEAVKAVEDGRIRFVPENWSKTYFEWMRNIQDWCISRQIWWGHRIPAWYDDQGNLYIGRSEEEVRKKHKLDPKLSLKQDEDVLDTWFSSALWPFSTLGWPEQTPELKTFYPTSVLVTGFDIIFFWVARMIMMGLKFTGEVPFREVYIHGLVRDAHGQKMSKSKGNILDPLDLIDGIGVGELVIKRTTGLMQPALAGRIADATRKEFPNGIPAYGTDALRFTFASLATQGRDIKFDLGRIEGYRNFCNKLWNAARYVLMNTEGYDCGQQNNEVELNVADRWIISRLQQVEADMEFHFKEYRLDLAAQTIYAFVWDEYCSWYVELSKVVLTSAESNPPALRGTRRTLARVLEVILRLLHPITPFITEAIWQKVAPLAGKKDDSIMLQPYPKSHPEKIDPAAIKEMGWVMAVITGVRNIRGEMDIAPSKPLTVLLQNGSDRDREYLQMNKPYLTGLARLESIKWLESGEEPPESAVALVGNMKVLLPLSGLINKQEEFLRLTRELEKIQKDLRRSEGKLANPSFSQRAPQEIVEQEHKRIAEFKAAEKNLWEQLNKIRGLPD